MEKEKIKNCDYLSSLIVDITAYLQKFSLVGNFQNEAELIISHITGKKRFQLYTEKNNTTSLQQEKIYNFLMRRVQGEPLAYILGEVEFYGRKFIVRPPVFIPRPETEILVEIAIHELQKKQSVKKKILEYGTGTGNISISFACEYKHINIISTDIDLQAILLAQKNMLLHLSQIIENNNKIEILLSHHFYEQQYTECFDMVISNPPYIKSSDIPHLQNEIRLWESWNALDGGYSGIEFYKKLATNTFKLLKKGGIVLLEHGDTQSKEIEQIFLKNANYELYKKEKDYNHKDRFLIFKKI